MDHNDIVMDTHEVVTNEVENIAQTNVTLSRKVWDESKKVWRVGGPAMIVRVSTFGALVVTQSFIGHGGETELAAYALVSSLFTRFVYGIMLGMGSATETLCGQAFGAKKYDVMGIYLQRSWLVLSATATILIPLFVLASPILRLLHQSKDTADEAGPIALWFIPTIISYVFSITTQMFLQSQSKNKIIAWVSLPTFFLHLLLSWVTVFKLHWGTAGAMVSMIMSSWFPIIGEFIYVFGGWCKDTWKGFSIKAFSDLMPMVNLSISSGIMLCLQVWYVSALVILAGYMPNAKVEIAAFSICLNISTWELMLSLGFLVSTSVRVSNELGKKNARGAKFAVKVSLINSSLTSLFFFFILLIFGKKIGYLFTKSQDVADAVADLSTLLAVSVLPNTIQPVLVGAAIGAGYQRSVAYINIACYYLIGMPLGIALGYKTDLRVKGIWIGMLCGTVAQVLSVVFITMRTDWDSQVEKASSRLNKWVVPVQDEEIQADHHNNSTHISN